MIIDSFKGFERYLSFHPRFAKAYQFLLQNDPYSLEAGRHDIMGREIYCTVHIEDLKEVEIPKLEVHDSYIDIHLLLEGNETIGHKDRSRCFAEDATYDEAKDIAFIDESPDNFINLTPGNLAVIFPHDAHAPLIGKGIIKKIVIKVLV